MRRKVRGSSFLKKRGQGGRPPRDEEVGLNERERAHMLWRSLPDMLAFLGITTTSAIRCLDHTD